MSIYFYSIASVLIVSLISLLGVFALSLKETLVRKYLFLLVSLAVGALIGDAFIHLIPEAFENTENPTAISLSIILGIFLFFLLEKFLHWHRHDTDEPSAVHPSGRMILFSDCIHNLLDGMIIAGSYMINIEAGIATTLAIILHEIPQEIGDFGVLVHYGYSTTRALILNFLSALAALVGAIIVLLIGETAQSVALYLAPIAAGGLIYIAMADLVPQLHKTKKVPHSLLQLISVVIGIVAMLFLLKLEV